MRLFFIFILTFLSTSFFAQQIKLDVTALDFHTGSPIVNAKVSATQGAHEYAANTNSTGKATIAIVTSTNIELRIDALGYDPFLTTRKVKNKWVKNGSGSLSFSLKEGVTMDVVDIVAPNMPKAIFKSEQLSVADYALLPDGYLILTYDKNPNKTKQLLLCDFDMNVQDSLSLYASKGKVVSIEQNFKEDVLLNTSTHLYQVTTDRQEIKLTTLDREQYDEQIRPVIDTLNNTVYWSNHFDRYPAFEYFDYQPMDSTYALVRQIADDFMMELCRAEYKYLSGRSKLLYWRQELKTGIEKEVLACIDRFENGLYYDPLYAPLFIHQDSILIFDHCDGLLCIYNQERTLLDSLPIDYHQPNKKINRTFQDLLIQDKIGGAIYAVYQNQGGKMELKKIDLQSGKIEEEINLHYPYPKDLQIHDGFAYYTYRPFESLQKRYLYKEKISEN